MVAIPDALRRGIEGEVQDAPRDELHAATERLMTTYQRERPASQPILRGRADALAYVAYRMPATYAAARHVFEQVAAIVSPVTMSDLGGGSGAATWAAADVFDSLTSVTVVEQVAGAVALGERLWAGRREGPTATWHTGPLGSFADHVERADLAVLAYVVGELGGNQRADVVAAARDHADTVVVVEPGTPTGHERVLEARSQLLESGWHVAAPCPHELACPWAGDGQWCHMSARVQRLPVQRQLKGGSMGHEDEKMAYVVMTRDPVDRPTGRIVRHPQTRKGMVELAVCHEDGDVRATTVTKRSPDEWRAVRKAAWGDPWPARSTPSYRG